MTLFKCGCNASARFIKADRAFVETSADVPMTFKSPVTIICVNCKQMYVWMPKTKDDPGGWRRQSPLDDLIELEGNGG